MTFTLEEIKDLMRTMQSTGLGKFELEQGDVKLKLAAKPQTVVQTMVEATMPIAAATEVPVAPAAQPAAPSGNVLVAPIVGTYYSAPSPDREPFVTVGKSVKKGDVLYIIESMKLMNEIQAEQDGVVTEILVQNGDAVEYNQPILVLN